MKRLSCKHTIRMIPLYIAGDVAAPTGRELAQHLMACESCARLETEFRANNELLREACALPEWGREFYDDLRHTVLEQVARDGRITRRFFGYHWIYASVVVTTVISSGLALLLFIRSNSEVSKGPGPIAAVTGASGMLPGPLRRASPPRFAPFRPRRHALPVRPASLPTETASRTDGPGPAPATASTNTISRIEIQTSNPNIKIIWLNPGNQEPQSTHRDGSEPRE